MSDAMSVTPRRPLLGCYDPGVSSRTPWLVLTVMALMVLPYLVVWLLQSDAVRF